jgi:hypothetical protein
MTLKGAALFAFIGTLLATVLLVWDFVADVINVTQGVVPPVKLLASLIFAFAALGVTVFFYMFQKSSQS